MERGGVGEARPAGAGDESGLLAGRFAGFPSSGRATPVPNLFFARLLPDIDKAEELLVTLYIFYIQGLQRRSPFFVTGSEMAADGALVRALANLCGEGGEALGRGLALATERGSLLRVEVKGDGRAEEAYLPATPSNRPVAERPAGARPPRGPSGRTGRWLSRRGLSPARTPPNSIAGRGRGLRPHRVPAGRGRGGRSRRCREDHRCRCPGRAAALASRWAFASQSAFAWALASRWG